MYFNEKMPPWLQIFCKWLLILLFAAFASCSQENKPEKLLTEDEIVRAMIEVYLAESKIINLNLPRDSARKIFEKANPIIFKKLGMTDTVFNASLDYYGNKPEQLEIIFSRVVDSLNLKEQKLNSQVK